MKKEFYRFRHINSLIGEFKELEKQSIYFSAPELLNDPMEGFRDVCWDGDFIVWRNLFRHYLLCLERLLSLLIICGEDHPISASDMPIFSGEDNFPTDAYKELFSEISEKFFKNENLIKLVKQIANRSTPVRRDELSLYFSSIHLFAIETINLVYETHGLISPGSYKNESSDKIIKALTDKNFVELLEKGLNESDNNENIIRDLFSVNKGIHSQLNLIKKYNQEI